MKKTTAAFIAMGTMSLTLLFAGAAFAQTEEVSDTDPAIVSLTDADAADAEDSADAAQEYAGSDAQETDLIVTDDAQTAVQDVTEDSSADVPADTADAAEPVVAVSEDAGTDTGTDTGDEETPEEPEKPVVKGKVKVGSANGTKGQIKVSGSASASNGVKKVEYEVWQKANKSDLHVYKADSSYAATVLVSNHKYHFGTYKVAMYVTDGDGNRVHIGTQKIRITAKNYIYATKINKAGTRWRVRIINAKNGSKWAKDVRVAVWSSKMGKTDLVTYKAKKYKGHNWRIFMNTKNHIFGGKYYAKVMLDYGQKKAGKVDFKAVKKLSAVEKLAEQRLTKTGRTLIKAFRWACMTYRSVNTRLIRDCDQMATIGLKNHYGNCGVMAATFYHLARRLGFGAHYVTGYVPLAGGGMGPHAWVEIKEGGRIWVYDPDFQHETGRNGFKIYYGKPGTWRYSAYSRVN